MHLLMDKIHLLDLFSGTGSVKKAAALDSDFECLSLDISDKFSKPDILIDIHDWDFRALPADSFDVIAEKAVWQL